MQFFMFIQELFQRNYLPTSKFYSDKLKLFEKPY